MLIQKKNCTNVHSEYKCTKHSNVLLLRLVYLFLEQMLNDQIKFDN